MMGLFKKGLLLKQVITRLSCAISLCVSTYPVLIVSADAFAADPKINLTVNVVELRNSNGAVLYSLYDRKDAFPDKDYKKQLQQLSGKIIAGTSTITFTNLSAGKYAVSLLHDEDGNGKIKTGKIFPLEGIGFSNYHSVGLFNKPSFKKASFFLQCDTTIRIQILYMAR